jgi:hypothetical protein
MVELTDEADYHPTHAPIPSPPDFASPRFPCPRFDLGVSHRVLDLYYTSLRVGQVRVSGR